MDHDDILFHLPTHMILCITQYYKYNIQIHLGHLAWTLEISSDFVTFNNLICLQLIDFLLAEPKLFQYLL